MSLFKNIVLYRIGETSQFPDLKIFEELAQKAVFVPCEPTQQLSVGFVPPRGLENGALVENVGEQLIMQLKVERKAVPGGAVKAELEARCKKIEADTGRKPGRKAKAELKEEIILTLLPRAFSKFSGNTLWIDRKSRLLVVGAGSVRGAEAAVGAIVDLLAEANMPIILAPLNTQRSPAQVMADWLLAKEAPDTFVLERDVELKSSDESKASVRYSRHNLELDEITNHIAEGKLPTRLALSWEGRVSFTLSDDLTLKKFDCILESENADPSSDAFDADVALTTGSLVVMLPALLNAMGGEAVAEENTQEGVAADTAA